MGEEIDQGTLGDLLQSKHKSTDLCAESRVLWLICLKRMVSGRFGFDLRFQSLLICSVDLSTATTLYNSRWLPAAIAQPRNLKLRVNMFGVHAYQKRRVPNHRIWVCGAIWGQVCQNSTNSTGGGFG